MNVKTGVIMDGVKPEILRALADISPIMEATGEFTVTSCCDGKHMPTSLHYKGLAVDVRSRHMDAVLAQATLGKIKEKLGGSYDVVLEADHLHIEFDP